MNGSAKDNLPLVSCIMPTFNRRQFIPLAIRYFLRQDYPDKELVIIDDGTDRVADLIPADPRIRYFGLPGRASTGAKRNLACKYSTGTLIAHWDDDDWYAPWRLSYQLEQLREAHADICGLDRVFFYAFKEEKVWEYVYPPEQRAWVYGASHLPCRSRKSIPQDGAATPPNRNSTISFFSLPVTSKVRR
jgi:glycosyltransferase involved in cell wall biosynthesis